MTKTTEPAQGLEPVENMPPTDHELQLAHEAAMRYLELFGDVRQGNTYQSFKDGWLASTLPADQLRAAQVQVLRYAYQRIECIADLLDMADEIEEKK